MISRYLALFIFISTSNPCTTFQTSQACFIPSEGDLQTCTWNITETPPCQEYVGDSFNITEACACKNLKEAAGISDPLTIEELRGLRSHGFGSYCAKWDLQSFSPWNSMCTDYRVCGEHNWCFHEFCYVDESCPLKEAESERFPGNFYSYTRCGFPNCFVNDISCHFDNTICGLGCEQAPSTGTCVPSEISPPLPSSAPAKAACGTYHGNVCEFPFRYEGVEYHTCLPLQSSDGYWCGTKYNVEYSNHTTWDYCVMDTCEVPCLTTDGDLCLFPFEHDGVQYNKCTDVGNHGYDWCYIVGWDGWGECGASCAKSNSTAPPSVGFPSIIPTRAPTDNTSNIRLNNTSNNHPESPSNDPVQTSSDSSFILM